MKYVIDSNEVCGGYKQRKVKKGGKENEYQNISLQKDCILYYKGY